MRFSSLKNIRNIILFAVIFVFTITPIISHAQNKIIIRPAAKKNLTHKIKKLRRPVLPLRIIKPSPKARYCAGSQMDIQWHSNLKTSEPVRLDILDGSTVFHTIVSQTPNNGRFVWTIPNNKFNYNLKQFKLRIRAIKSNTRIVSQGFYIGKSVMTINKPTSNQIVKKRLSYEITWTQGCFSGNPPASYKLELLNASKAFVKTIHSSVAWRTASPQTYNWQVPDNLNNERHFIRITTNGGTLYAEQPVLVASMPHPWKSGQITILKPSSTIYWCSGQTLEIRWQSNLPGSSKVKIQLLKYNYDPKIVLSASTNNDGVFQTTAPQGLSSASYHVAVGTPDDSIITESGTNIIYRSNAFSVTGPGNTQIWQMGSAVSFAYWISNCFSGNTLKLQLLAANNNIAVEIATLSGGNQLRSGSSHSFQWTVPVSLNPGWHKLKILDPNTGQFATSNVNIGFPQ
ncbi:MAG: GPI anchored serine-threonine rich family protein [Desulfobacula sp.]|nr:GPI anchored serine-threonine rich family protein [Desulfobacula sp.]